MKITLTKKQLKKYLGLKPLILQSLNGIVTLNHPERRINPPPGNFAREYLVSEAKSSNPLLQKSDPKGIALEGKNCRIAVVVRRQTFW